MANLGRSGGIRPLLDGNEVEPVPVGGATEARPPELGEPSQDGPLPVVDGLLGMAKAEGSASLDLDEGDQIALPGHQVDIVMSEPEPVRLDVPACLEEVHDREPLSGIAPAVPGIGPFGDGFGDARGGHGRR